MADAEVIAIRIPKRLKHDLKELDVDSGELRENIEKLVKQKKLKKMMKSIDAFREKMGKKTGITSSSAEFIRWDREHGH